TALAAAGYHALAIDLPPFGYSDRPADGRYDKERQGHRIATALASLGLSQVVLVGHSFGGGPTVEAALASPERLRGLVLVDAALSIRSGEAEAPSAVLRTALSVGPLRDALVAGFLTNPARTRSLVRSFIAPTSPLTDERVAIYQRPLSVKGTTAAVSAWLPSLLMPAASRSE